MFRIAAVDCDAFASLCTKENLSKYPTFRVYPAFPAPTEDYTEQTVDFEKIKKLASRFIGSRVIDIT